MACYFQHPNDTFVKIPSSSINNGINFYDIEIKINNVIWFVSRRYRDFFELHEKIVKNFLINRQLPFLPPKKAFINKTPSFVENRRQLLEEYLQNLLKLFNTNLPDNLIEFLDFNKYDIVYLLHELAIYFSECGNSGKEFNFSSLELYAISERMKIPCPSCDRPNNKSFSHVLDFCSQLELITVTPIKTPCEVKIDYNAVDVPIGKSNLIPKNLIFNLNAFRNLRTLKVYGVSTECISEIANLKLTLNSLYVHNTTVTKFNQILMCDNIHKNEENDNVPNWECMEILNVAGNLLTTIDTSIKLAPKLKVLVIDQNQLDHISNLNYLCDLNTLSLCENLIADLHNWHVALGNLVTLNLSQNKLHKLGGLKKMYSLVNLDLSCNLIEDMNEIEHLGNLPLLENLRLAGNPLAGSVDYRPRVLARFNERAVDICLDNEKGSSSELDMALVISALHVSNKAKSDLSR